MQARKTKFPGSRLATAGAIDPGGFPPFTRLAARGMDARRDHAEAEHRYRDIVENCAWGIFQTTADGQYLKANPALARIYGYTTPAELLSALIDISAQLYVDPARRDEFRRVMKQHRIVTGFESQVYRRDGAIIWIAETCREVRATTGKLLYYEGTVEDISERKRTEIELREAKEKAEAANNAKSRFLATMSHELRTPLNAIIGFAEIINQQTLGPAGVPQYADYAGDIHHSGRRLLGVINDILDLAQIDSGRNLTGDAPVDLGALAAEITRESAASAEAAQIRLAVPAPEIPVLARGDERMLRRIMLALLGNAIKFTPPGGNAAIEVAATPEGASFAVRDTGIGIAASDLLRLIEPFFQADAGLDRQHEGAGLGLAICDRLVRLHGGALNFESAPGQGTTATVWLPAAPAEDRTPSAG